MSAYMASALPATHSHRASARAVSLRRAGTARWLLLVSALVLALGAFGAPEALADPQDEEDDAVSFDGPVVTPKFTG
jgi:hypothetical protein